MGAWDVNRPRRNETMVQTLCRMVWYIVSLALLVGAIMLIARLI